MQRLRFLRSAGRHLQHMSARTRCLSGLWALFLVLVAMGVHGSSLPCAASWWAQESKYSGYGLGLLSSSLPEESDPDGTTTRALLMAEPRRIRSDEWLVNTPLELAQLAHHPRFPVVNTNIGTGQNMLVWTFAPVLHLVTLARPATWGYFFLGAQRGLAWQWWFQLFACFTVLYLLLEIVLQGHVKLAAFGAFWFCGSAYVICWSLWPAYTTLFPALACVAAYRILESNKPRVQIVCGILLGLSLPGFLMILYPPWQIPLAYLFLIIFAGLIARDRLYLVYKSINRARLIGLALALVLSVGLGAAYLSACLPDLRVMAGTVYPGGRFSAGGGYPFWRLLKGLYNSSTIYAAGPLGNESESASFYYLFPAAVMAICLSKRLFKGVGTIGWLLVAYLGVLLLFIRVGIPHGVARVTLLGYTVPARTDIAIGLASIILCM